MRISFLVLVLLLFGLGPGRVSAQEMTRVTALAWSPDGTTLAIADDNGYLYLQDEAGKLTQSIFVHEWGVVTIDWSPDGKFLASGGRDGVIKIWKPDTSALIQTIDAHSEGVISLDWGPENGTLVHTFTAHSGDVISMDWSPAGSQLASITLNELFIWDTTNWSHTHTLPLGTVTEAEWSPDGSILAVGGHPNNVFINDGVTFNGIRMFTGHQAPVNTVEWSIDSHYLATGDLNGNVLVWDAATGEALINFESFAGSIWDLAFSPNGRRLAVATDSGNLLIFETANGAVLNTIQHSGRLLASAWSPDGSQLAYGGEGSNGAPIFEIIQVSVGPAPETDVLNPCNRHDTE